MNVHLPHPCPPSMHSGRSRGSRKASAGISLIEVLAAVLLVSFGILGLLALLGKSTQATIGGDDNQRAAMLVNELGTLMWTQYSPTIAAGDLTAWQARVSNPAVAGLANGVGTVTVSGQAAHVVITWTANTGTPGQPSNVSRQYTTDIIIPPR